jgi:hypothetical protein
MSAADDAALLAVIGRPDRRYKIGLQSLKVRGSAIWPPEIEALAAQVREREVERALARGEGRAVAARAVRLATLRLEQAKQAVIAAELP